MIPGLGSVMAGLGSGGPPSVSYRTSSLSTINNTDYTFNSIDFGSASGRSLVVVCVTGTRVPDNTSTIGGVAATVTAGIDPGTAASSIMYAVVPSGSSGTVFVDFASAGVNVSRCGIHVFAVYNLDSTTPTDTATDSSESGDLASTIDVSASGILIACGSKDNNTTSSWTGVTERFDSQSEGTHTCGDYTSTGSAETGRAIEIDWAGGSDESSLSAVSWR
jgi:hypothetical protein